MYEAINNYVIGKKLSNEEVTDTGIILTADEGDEYLIIATTFETEKLKGKKVRATEVQPLKKDYVAIDYHNIMAVIV